MRAADTNAHRRADVGGGRGRLRRYARSPAVHFAALGACLFVAGKALDPRGTGVSAGSVAAAPAPPAGAATSTALLSVAGKEIVMGAALVHSIRRAYAADTGAAPTDGELQALVDSAIEEEVLFREALTRGLDRGDRAIAWRVVQKMRFLGEDDGAEVGALYERGLALGLHLQDPVVRRILVEKIRLLVGQAGTPPSADELAAYYEVHKGEYAQPPRLTFEHVFFSRTRRGADAQAAANAEAVRRARAASDGDRGDPFAFGARLASQSPQDLAKLFGPAFAQAAAVLEPGAWSPPLESAYGWHLVRVESRQQQRVPDLAEVSSRVEKALIAERRDRRVAEFLKQVRPSYVVKIDGATLSGASNGRV